MPVSDSIGGPMLGVAIEGPGLIDALDCQHGVAVCCLVLLRSAIVYMFIPL